MKAKNLKEFISNHDGIRNATCSRCNKKWIYGYACASELHFYDLKTETYASEFNNIIEPEEIKRSIRVEICICGSILYATIITSEDETSETIEIWNIVGK